MEFKKLNKKIAELETEELKEKQHQKGKLTARERINLVLDEDSFVELDAFVETRFNALGLDKKKFAGDSVITGFGKINNKNVYIYSQDFSKMGGSLGEMHGNKIAKVIDLAANTGSPVIGIIDSGGARIQEGVSSLDGYAKVFKSMVRASGVVPQISVIAGPSAGGASYAPGLSDFIFMIENISEMYITGPDVIKQVTGEEITSKDLGGSVAHTEKSGCAHFLFQNEQDCFLGVKQLLSYLPSNNLEDAPRENNFLGELFEKEEIDDLEKIIPEDNSKAYNIKDVISRVFDKNSFFEVHSKFAINTVVGFAKLTGKTVGIVANQARFSAGVLDIDSSDKVARFVRVCDAFNIPIINLIDTPGYLPGKSQEHQGIIRHGAKVLYAYAEATVPKISLIVRKAFGGAYIALTSRELGYDTVIAYPGAQIAVMGAEQAVKIIFKRELAESKDPKKLEEEKIKELKERFLDAFEAAKLGQVDLIIEPKDTRKVLIKCLDSLSTKRGVKISRKHGNIPL